MKNKPPLIIALIAVAAAQGVDLSWLDVNVEFEWRGGIYKLDEYGSCREFRTKDGYIGLCCAEDIMDMLKSTDQITRSPSYTPEEAAQAVKDMECSVGFEWVSKDKTDIVFLWTNEPHMERGGFAGGDHSVWSRYAYYPSLKPGEKERLEVIAGCAR